MVPALAHAGAPDVGHRVAPDDPMPEAVPVWNAALPDPLLRFWRWLRKTGTAHLRQTRARRMRVCETVSLGEKRFVSVLEVDGSSFLIGGGTGGVTFLKELASKPSPTSFRGALKTSWADEESA